MKSAGDGIEAESANWSFGGETTKSFLITDHF